MPDVLSDFMPAYNDFGGSTPVEGKENILVIKDELLEEDDDGMETRRVMATAMVERGDVLVLNGVRWQVARKTAYGDADEEFLLKLSVAR